MTPEQIKLLSDWQAAKAAAVEAKKVIEAEMELRKAVVASFFITPKEGTNNLELEAGWKLKYVHGLDYKLDEAVMDTVRWQLTEAGVSSDRLFKYKPELSVTEYRLLADNIRPIVDAALTIKPKSPTLELIPPKK